MPAAETFRLGPIGNRGCSSPETRDQMSTSFSYPLSTGRDEHHRTNNFNNNSVAINSNTVLLPRPAYYRAVKRNQVTTRITRR